MSIVNKAYSIEHGNTGLAFKCAPRYSCKEECLMDIGHTLVGTLQQKIVCSDKAVVDEATDVVEIGPIAVDPKHQGKGYGRQLLEKLEGLATHQQLKCVSCRTDILVIYQRRNYTITQSQPITDYIPKSALTRTDLQMYTMKKVKKCP